MTAKHMARKLCWIAPSIVLMTALTTVANAGEIESQRLKVSDHLTVWVGESQRVSYRVTAAILEILPNGTLVLKAQKSGVDSNNLWVYTLGGKVDPKSVSAYGCVLSENIANLTICKHLIDLNDFIGPF